MKDNNKKIESIQKIGSIQTLERLAKFSPKLLLVTDAVTTTLLDLFSEDFDALDKCAGLVVEATTAYEHKDSNEEFYQDLYLTFRNKLLSAIQDSFSDEEIIEIAGCVDHEDCSFDSHSGALSYVFDKLHTQFTKQYKQEHRNKQYFDHPVQNSVYYKYAIDILLEEYCHKPSI